MKILCPSSRYSFRVSDGIGGGVCSGSDGSNGISKNNDGGCGSKSDGDGDW